MNDQFTLSGFEEPSYNEDQFLGSIFEQLQNIVEEKCGDRSILTRKRTKSYTAVFLSSLTAFRLCFRGKNHYISLLLSLKDIIPPDVPTKTSNSDTKYIRVLVNDEHPADSYVDILVQAIVATIERYPKDWDCCSRYMECSDAKVCVHPDKAFALSCGYRKILASGRIFYGKNRNID